MTQRLNRYFVNSSELRQLTSVARDLATLDRLYRSVAPPALLRASRALKIEQQILTLEAGNAAVAAKLRQLAPQLTAKLRQTGAEVTGIRVRVQVDAPAPPPPREHRSLGSAGRRQMAELARSLPESPLKNAVKRLAKLDHYSIARTPPNT